VQPNAIGRYVPQSTIDFGNDCLDKGNKFTDRFVLVRYMALKGEVRRVDLQNESRPDDGFVFDAQRFAERLQIALQRIVVFILDRRCNNAGRRGIHERLDKDIGSESKDVFEVAAFAFDRRRILIADIAYRHGQTLIRRYARLTRGLLQPTLLEHRIAVNIGTRRPLPGPAETSQSLFQIEEK